MPSAYDVKPKPSMMAAGNVALNVSASTSNGYDLLVQPSADVRAEYRERALRLEIERLTPSNAELLAWARRCPPPQEWWDEDVNPFE